jgi:hypothetical protein
MKAYKLRLTIREAMALLLACVYTFGFGGGRSRALHSLMNPLRPCVPSQNGLFSAIPQRQSAATTEASEVVIVRQDGVALSAQFPLHFVPNVRPEGCRAH